MKEKTKKIIAGLGLGLMVGSGAMLTGCTGLGLSDEESARMMEIVENADQFMTDIKDDMDNLNTNFDELQSSVDGLKEEKITKEQAYDLLRLANAKIEMYDDSIYSNMKLTMTTNDEIGQIIIKYYKMDDGKKVFQAISGTSEEIQSSDVFCYEIEDKTLLISYDMEEKQTISAPFEYVAGVLQMFPEEEIELNNVIDFKLLENGNYSITCFYKIIDETDNWTYLMTYEITSEGIVDSIVVLTKLIRVINDEIGETCTYMYNSEMVLEYGVLTESEMQAEIDKVLALPEASEE